MIGSHSNSMRRRQMGPLIVALVVLATVIFYLNYANTNSYSSTQGIDSIIHSSIDEYRPIDVQIYSVKRSWFLKKCLSGVNPSQMSMESLDDYIRKFHSSEIDLCKNIGLIFNSMFEIEINDAEIRIDNDVFKNKVKKWLDNNDEYLKQAYKQKVIKVYNKFYHDEMIFNALRGKRPQAKQALSEKNYSMDLLKSSESGCDFCSNNYKLNTANDIFDRLETKLSYSAANTFKYDKWHSLIVSRNHNTLYLNEEEIVDMFKLSSKWFNKVNSLSSDAIYPEWIWDAMPKSGASQVHTHLQVSMGEKGYYGYMRRWLDASVHYFNAHKRDFFDDFILIHRALGLTYETRNVIVIMNLIPLKDQEIMIVGDNNDPETYEDVSRMVHKLIRIFVDKLEQYSFSAGGYLPTIKSTSYDSYSSAKLRKIYCRITFRSPVANLRSDFNGLDLYTSSVIGLDRYKLAKRVFDELAKTK